MTYYTSAQVADVAEVSLRRLQIWDEAGIVSPKHEGHRRLYTEGDALHVVIVAELKRKGVRPSSVKLAMPTIKGALTKQHRHVNHLMLAIDAAGRTVLSRFVQDVLDAVVASRRPMWVLHVGDLLKRLPQSPTLDKGEAA